jgi:hypothetical protein
MQTIAKAAHMLDALLDNAIAVDLAEPMREPWTRLPTTFASRSPIFGRRG